MCLYGLCVLVRQERKAAEQNSHAWELLFWVKLPDAFHVGKKKLMLKNNCLSDKLHGLIIQKWLPMTRYSFYFTIKPESTRVFVSFHFVFHHFTFLKIQCFIKIYNIGFIILLLDSFLFLP